MAISKRLRSAVVTVGVVFLALGLAFFWDYFSFSPNTTQVEGRVLSIDIKIVPKATVYASTAAYTIDGAEYTTQDGFFTNIWKPSDGDKVIILYKTDQPKISRIYYWSPYSVPLVFVVIGASLLMFVFFGKLREERRS